MTNATPPWSLTPRAGVASLTLLGAAAALLAGCGAIEAPRAPLVVGPAQGPIGEWIGLPWDGADPTVAFNGAHLRASGDTAYLLVADRFYRSDDHGAHWSLRGTELLDDFAIQGPRLFGWSGNQEAPLFTSSDDGATWRGRPVASYSGDQILSTGALASPRMLQVVGPIALMTQPSDESRLFVSDDPARPWAPVTLGGRVRDVAAYGDALYACTHAGFFRSTDRGKAWSAIAPPDGSAEPIDACTFARFTTLLCATVGHFSGQRLYCSADGETWKLADDGLFDAPKNPDWNRFQGLAYPKGSAQLGPTYVIADRGDNVYAAREEGLYTTTDPFSGWTRVEALRGRRVVDVAQTTQAILVLTQMKGDRSDVPVQLFRLRVR